MPTVFSIIESPSHPPLAELYARLGIDEVRVSSMRKALQLLKQRQPEFVVADFLYGYGNNYAGVNVSNLDVFLHSLQKYAPQARVIVLVDKAERQYVDKLQEIVPLHAVLIYPVKTADLEPLLR